MDTLRQKAMIEIRVREVPLQLSGPVPENVLLGTELLGGCGGRWGAAREPPEKPARGGNRAGGHPEPAAAPTGGDRPPAPKRRSSRRRAPGRSRRREAPPPRHRERELEREEREREDRARVSLRRSRPRSSGGDAGAKDAGSFFLRVYAFVRKVPRGRVVTYGQVAALLGVPHGARAVGWAMRGLDPRQEARCRGTRGGLRRADLAARGSGWAGATPSAACRGRALRARPRGHGPSRNALTSGA